MVLILDKRVKNMREKIYNIIDVDGNEDILSVLYDRVMIFCILGSVIPLCFKGNSVVFIWIEKVTVWLFIIDYILRWITADFRHSERKKMAFIEYPFTFYGIVDLLSILPSLVVLNSSFKLFRLLRLNKAFKALRLLRYSKSFNMILSVVQRERQALITVCVLAGGYIFLVALIMFQVEPESFNSFFDAIYLSVVTLTTVGYGDIYPISQMGKVISMISSFMGIAIVALPTGIITAGYMNELNKREKENDK